MKLRAPAAFARVPAGACSSTRMLEGTGYNEHGQVLGNRCKVQGNQVLGTLYQVVSQEVQVVPAVEDTQAVSNSQIQSNYSEYSDARDPDLSLRVATEP